MFGCKQSGGRSQALCLCLRLLRQLGASQEASPAAGQDGQRDGRTDGRTEPEAGRQCGGGFIAGWQRGAAASFGSGSLGAVGAHVGAELGARGPLVSVWDPIPGAAPGSGTRGGRHPSGATGRLRRQGRGGAGRGPAGAEVGTAEVPAGHRAEQRCRAGGDARRTDAALGRSPAARPSHPTSRQRGAGPGAASRALRPCPEADVTEGGGRPYFFTLAS